MLRFSLKFCTAIEWPADISMWPRCCSSAFIGTTKKPARPPITTGMTHAISRNQLIEAKAKLMLRPARAPA